MSATSTKIFGNDMAMDVKDDFRMLYGIEKSIEEKQDYILNCQPDDDDEEACAFWSALALVEWEYGVLTQFVKEKTKEIIYNNSDASLFIREKDQKSRDEELQNLLGKLDTANLSPKKRKKTFVYRTKWKVGDILAIPVGEFYVYMHVCAVIRDKRKIKELEEDAVYIKVFDIISKELLDIEQFKDKTKYKTLSSYKKNYVEWLWCVGIREKNALEKKVICIGNVPTEIETTNWVAAAFQFSVVEETLKKLFNIES